MAGRGTAARGLDGPRPAPPAVVGRWDDGGRTRRFSLEDLVPAVAADMRRHPWVIPPGNPAGNPAGNPPGHPQGHPQGNPMGHLRAPRPIFGSLGATAATPEVRRRYAGDGPLHVRLGLRAERRDRWLGYRAFSVAIHSLRPKPKQHRSRPGGRCRSRDLKVAVGHPVHARFRGNRVRASPASGPDRPQASQSTRGSPESASSSIGCIGGPLRRRNCTMPATPAATKTPTRARRSPSEIGGDAPPD